MKKFEFSKSKQPTESIFSGEVFYNVYKEAEFLRDSANIETILSKGYELRKMLKGVKPGERVTVNGMWLKKKTPLLVRKTGENVTVENFEFTANRLCGLAAAYAFDNRHRLPDIKSSEAITLGLTWDNKNNVKCRLYLSAVSGSEHFYNQFSFWSLVCALRKFQLKKIPLEPVVKMANKKNKNGVRMAQELMRNLQAVKILWKQFPGQSDENLETIFCNLPNDLKNVLCAE